MGSSDGQAGLLPDHVLVREFMSLIFRKTRPEKVGTGGKSRALASCSLKLGSESRAAGEASVLSACRKSFGRAGEAGHKLSGSSLSKQLCDLVLACGWCYDNYPMLTHPVS